MTYLLDADVFIECRKREYGFDICPAFWEWLVGANGQGLVFSVARVRDELQDEHIRAWALAHGDLFLEPTDDTVLSLRALTAWTHARRPTYTQGAISTFLDDAADSQLVAHAHAIGATVVTRETPAPEGFKRIKVPDAADGLGVPWVDPWTMLRECGARFVLEANPVE